MNNTTGVIVSIVCGLIPAVAAVLLARRGQLANVKALQAAVGAIVAGLLVTLIVGLITKVADGWLNYVIVAVISAGIVWPTFGNAAKAEVTDATN